MVRVESRITHNYNYINKTSFSGQECQQLSHQLLLMKLRYRVMAMCCYNHLHTLHIGYNLRFDHILLQVNCGTN